MELFEHNEAKISINKCGKCKHIEKHQCCSKYYFYCGIRKSKRTSNGLLKVKCKTTACNLFKTQ